MSEQDKGFVLFLIVSIVGYIPILACIIHSDKIDDYFNRKNKK